METGNFFTSFKDTYINFYQLSETIKGRRSRRAIYNLIAEFECFFCIEKNETDEKSFSLLYYNVTISEIIPKPSRLD